MIKVVNIISDTNIGGAGKVLLHYAKNYDKTKYCVSVIVPKGSALVEELKNTSVQVMELDGLKDKSLDLKSLLKLIKVLKQEKPDIVHTHASSVARLAARFIKGTKIVYTRHCAYPVSNKIKKGPGHFLYKHVNEYFSDRIIAVGDAAKENLLEGGISEEMIDTFFNGVEKIKETSAAEKKKLKDTYHIQEDESVIGIVARLEEVKGQDVFIDAAKILLEEKKVKAKFFILGTGSEEDRLKQKVKDLGLSDDIIFTGFVKNVGEYLNIFDIQVNCSFGTETSSLSLLEGMSLGVPAVASNYGGNPYLIQDGENGYIVPIKSPEETANAIDKILKNEDIRGHMKQKSVEIFEERFTVERFTKNVESVYEKVLKQPNKGRINILDIFIILIAIVVAVFGYSYLKRDGGEIASPNTQKVVYQIRTNESLPNVYDYIEEGTVLYDSQKNYNIGTIISKEYESSKRYAVSQETKEVVATELDDRIDIIFTVEANATVTDKKISVGDYTLKVGNEAYVRGKGYAAIGYIISVER